MKSRLFPFNALLAFLFVSQPGHATTVEKPKVTEPSVAAPAAPANPQVATQAATGAAVTGVTRAFDEPTYKRLSEGGIPVVLVFSDSRDPIWQKQAQLLSVIFREIEFAKIQSFQIDLVANHQVANQFNVSSPGTILIMKDGIERVRSTKMTGADPMRKMLRLQSAL
ncbi:MAG: hypothetical protein RBT63_09130 [Bdellovibrionales bacterium]|jgi:hypothetical protein|nr:hypothetical protein [Bdellovibrionales bacterium]